MEQIIDVVEAEPIERTSEYDAAFFRDPTSTAQVLADARIGLDLFLGEAEKALRNRDLTIDQRLHISTIVSYISALGDRFDRVRSAEFAQKTTSK